MFKIRLFVTVFAFVKVCGFNEDKAATKRHLQICNWLHIYLLPEV